MNVLVDTYMYISSRASPLLLSMRANSSVGRAAGRVRNGVKPMPEKVCGWSVETNKKEQNPHDIPTIKDNMIPRNHNEISGVCDYDKYDALSSAIDNPFVTSMSFGWEHFAPPIRDDTGASSVEPTLLCTYCNPSLRTKFTGHSPNKRSRTTKPPKSVSFSNLAIREYAVILGDNPSARSLPITLSWAHTEEPIIHDIDSYEETRNGQRRRGEGIRMSYVEKRLLLREHGFKEEDIRRAQHESNVNRSRIRSYSFVGQAHGTIGGDTPSSSSTIRRVKTLVVLQSTPSE